MCALFLCPSCDTSPTFIQLCWSLYQFLDDNKQLRGITLFLHPTLNCKEHMMIFPSMCLQYFHWSHQTWYVSFTKSSLPGQVVIKSTIRYFIGFSSTIGFTFFKQPIFKKLNLLPGLFANTKLVIQKKM